MSCPPSPTLSATSAEFVHIPDDNPVNIPENLRAYIQTEIAKGIAEGLASARSELKSDLMAELRTYIDEEFEDASDASETSSTTTTSLSSSSETSDSSTSEELAELQDRLERLDTDLTHECEIRAELGVSLSDFQHTTRAQMLRLLTMERFNELKEEVLREVRVTLAAGRETQRLYHARTRVDLLALIEAQRKHFSEEMARAGEKQLEAYRDEFGPNVTARLEELEHASSTATRRISRLRRTQRRLSAAAESMVRGTEQEEVWKAAWAKTVVREGDQEEGAWKWLDAKREEKASPIPGAWPVLPDTESPETTNETATKTEDESATEGAMKPAIEAVSKSMSEVKIESTGESKPADDETTKSAQSAPSSILSSAPKTKGTFNFTTPSTIDTTLADPANTPDSSPPATASNPSSTADARDASEAPEIAGSGGSTGPSAPSNLRPGMSLYPANVVEFKDGVTFRIPLEAAGGRRSRGWRGSRGSRDGSAPTSSCGCRGCRKPKPASAVPPPSVNAVELKGDAERKEGEGEK